MDLGLPSGTKWATQNVGAYKPSDYGLYFQWGDAQGYTAEQVGIGEGKKKFADDGSDYKWFSSANGGAITKYTTNGAMLELEDDAAHANMGGSWHMPTPTQISELLNNTTTVWTTSDNVSGMTFTSTTNGKSIFIPAAGYAFKGSVKKSGSGLIWSSMLATDNYFQGKYLECFSQAAQLLSNTRIIGFSVRGVID